MQDEGLERDEVKNDNLVRKGIRKLKPDMHQQNYYLKIDEKIVGLVESYGFPKPYILKCINDNVNNHCTASYYLL